MVKFIKKWRIHYIFLALFIAASVYLMTGYSAENTVKTYMVSSDLVTVTNGSVVSFQPSSPNGTGFIFYPGGKVDPLSYAPMLFKLSEKGYSCYLVKMPFNLAVFNGNGGEAVIKEHPEIQEWVVSGHSLGGVMASDFVSKHDAQISGIVFLASYPLNETVIKDNEFIRSLSIYATLDGFVSSDAIEEHLKLLPKNHEIFLIEGGNHSQFGYYGFQNGDGKSTISHDAQLTQVVNKIDSFLSKEE